MSSDGRPDAFENYCLSLADLYAVSGVAADGLTGFSSATTAFRFGSSSIAHGRSGPQTLTRGQAEIQRSGIDHILIAVNQADTIGDCDGRSLNAEAGTVQFRDLNRPSTTRADRIDTLTILVPRSILPSWLMSRGLHGRTLPVTTPGGRLVASHVKTLYAVAADLTEDEGLAAVEATFVIAERFLGQTGPVTLLQTEAIHRTIRQRVIRLVDARLADGPIEISRIARDIGVSRSSLYRAFESSGGIQALILRRRLDLAYVALRMHAGPRLVIASLAQEYGFSSESVFIRAFRDRFGFRPDKIDPWVEPGRNAMPVPNAQGVYDGAAHEVIMDWLRHRHAT
jgi:AraC-like DNA-binding protein